MGLIGLAPKRQLFAGWGGGQLPQAMTDNDPIDTVEGPVQIGWDFSNLLPSTTIASIKSTSCSVSPASSVPDPAASTRLTGGSSIVASPAPPNGSGRASLAVAQNFTPGVAGCIYLLTCVVIDTNGNAVAVWMRQAVVAPD